MGVGTPHYGGMSVQAQLLTEFLLVYRYKGKTRIMPTVPNQPSEASAHFMFELAKNVLLKAGGSSATSLFTQPSSSTPHAGPHRHLHLCAFQIGLYALGLSNCVSPNWLSRTYSSHVSWIAGQCSVCVFWTADQLKMSFLDCWSVQIQSSGLLFSLVFRIAGQLNLLDCRSVQSQFHGVLISLKLVIWIAGQFRLSPLRCWSVQCQCSQLLVIVELVFWIAGPCRVSLLDCWSAQSQSFWIDGQCRVSLSGVELVFLQISVKLVSHGVLISLRLVVWVTGRCRVSRLDCWSVQSQSSGLLVNVELVFLIADPHRVGRPDCLSVQSQCLLECQSVSVFARVLVSLKLVFWIAEECTHLDCWSVYSQCLLDCWSV